ncbi:MAG TPA: sulfurtransferase [Propionibacteriaceae bacterium]|nr:sulfurtransferase [Propionibacteriaceae bacterium]
MTSSDAVLISLAELAELLDSVQPPVVADVRWTVNGPPGKPDFVASHIPGAVWVDLETQLTGPPGVGGRHPLPVVAVFEQAMRDIGVRQDSLVVAYDAATSQAAARLWWLLTDAGHRYVRVLNGGLAAWRAAGLPTVSGPGDPPPRGDFIARPGQRPQLNAVEISALLGRPEARTLIDVRAAERYSGQHEPIDPVAGHIPGAVNLPATANLQADGRFLPPAEIARLYAEAGGREDAVLYCGSGITASHSLLALESAGLTAAIYPGSWSDWISDPSRPIATGN